MSDIHAVTYLAAYNVVTGGARDSNGPYAALQATQTAGLVTVVTMQGGTIQVYLPLGVIVPLAVRQVTALNGAAGVIGLCAHPISGQGQ